MTQEARMQATITTIYVDEATGRYVGRRKLTQAGRRSAFGPSEGRCPVSEVARWLSARWECTGKYPNRTVFPTGPNRARDLCKSPPFPFPSPLIVHRYRLDSGFGRRPFFDFAGPMSCAILGPSHRHQPDTARPVSTPTKERRAKKPRPRLRSGSSQHGAPGLRQTARMAPVATLDPGPAAPSQIERWADRPPTHYPSLSDLEPDRDRPGGPRHVGALAIFAGASEQVMLRSSGRQSSPYPQSACE